MGFLDKLFNAKNNALIDALKDLTGKEQAAQQSAPQPQPQQAPAAQPVYTEDEPSPSGWSWGEKMPDEDNQYNFSGTYDQYFDSVLRDAFPEYEITFEETGRQGQYGFIALPGKKITFRKDGATALIIELISEKSSKKKLREDCKAAGIPYLRYYYDYHGWWNTRSYVVERTRKALNL